MPLPSIHITSDLTVSNVQDWYNTSLADISFTGIAMITPPRRATRVAALSIGYNSPSDLFDYGDDESTLPGRTKTMISKNNISKQFVIPK